MFRLLLSLILLGLSFTAFAAPQSAIGDNFTVIQWTGTSGTRSVSANSPDGVCTGLDAIVQQGNPIAPGPPPVNRVFNGMTSGGGSINGGAYTCHWIAVQNGVQVSGALDIGVSLPCSSATEHYDLAKMACYCPAPNVWWPPRNALMRLA